MNIKKCYSGFTLFETTLTIIITSIVFAIAGLFMAKPMLLFNNITQQSMATNQVNTGLHTIANDFAQYNGAFSISSNTANTLSMQFKILNNSTITYTCDFNVGMVYRISSVQGSQNLLNNLTTCYVRSNVSPDGKTLFLSVRLGITKNNIPVTLTEILNAPNV